MPAFEAFVAAPTPAGRPDKASDSTTGTKSIGRAQIAASGAGADGVNGVDSAEDKGCKREETVRSGEVVRAGRSWEVMSRV